MWTKEEREKRRRCAPLLPAPGDEVLIDALDQLDALERDLLATQASNESLRASIAFADSARQAFERLAIEAEAREAKLRAALADELVAQCDGGKFGCAGCVATGEDLRWAEREVYASVAEVVHVAGCPLHVEVKP